MKFSSKVFQNKIALFLCVFLGINLFQMAPARAAYVDCLSVGYPFASMGSTALVIRSQITTKCTNKEFGLVGGSFVYSVLDESFMARCEGATRVSQGFNGTLTCTLPVGDSNGSTRVGATSTTIRIWSSGDFSTKFVSVNHSPIPSAKKVVTPVPMPIPTTTTSNPQPTQTPTPLPTSNELTSLTSLAASVASLRALIVTLTNLVLKIQKTVKDI
jgi:hypothetical protein